MPISSISNGSIPFRSKLLSDQCDGLTTNFNTPPFQRGTLVVFWNGIAQSNNEITILSASSFHTSFVPTSEDTLFITFIKL